LPVSAIVTKVDIIHRLARARGYRRYLEFCTPTTGMRFAEIDRSRFATVQRLLYCCPPGYSDGLPIDHRASGVDIAVCLPRLKAIRPRFDIALVDSNHEYLLSWRDLVAVFALLREGGAMVVHDCLPPFDFLVNPEPQPGGWCGTSYKAFVDFVIDRADLDYLTVDVDYGCGVVTKRSAGAGMRGLSRDLHALARLFGAHRGEELRRRAALARWRALGDDYAAAWRLLRRKRRALLNLVSPEEFVAGTRRRVRAM
jgi:hypothetical protein